MVECTSVYTPAARRSLTGHTLFSRRLRDTYTALRKDFPASDEDPQIKEYWSLADPRFGLQTPLSQISSMRFHTFSPRSPRPFTSLEIVKHGLRDLAAFRLFVIVHILVYTFSFFSHLGSLFCRELHRISLHYFYRKVSGGLFQLIVAGSLLHSNPFCYKYQILRAATAPAIVGSRTSFFPRFDHRGSLFCNELPHRISLHFYRNISGELFQ
jgi:hypothetical protein